jgi:hypothetical protein
MRLGGSVRRSSRSSSGKPWTSWGALLVALSALVAAGAHAAPLGSQRGSTSPPWGQPGQPPSPCKHRATLKGIPKDQSRVLCGTSRSDKHLMVPGGPYHPAIAVYGLTGKDNILARSGAADIHGGPGKDRAVIHDQRTDHWSPDTERVYDLEGRRISSASSPSAGASDFDPSKVPLSQVRTRQPAAKCIHHTDGTWFIRFSDEPTVRAFNSIPTKVEFQKVAYSAGLYKWDPTVAKWVLVDPPGPWLWDETYDLDWTPFLGNFWRQFDTTERTFTSFTIAGADTGYYRLKIAYYWYGTTQSYKGQTERIPDFSIFEWVKYFFGDVGLTNDKTAKFPTGRYCVFGVDPAGGP